LKFMLEGCVAPMEVGDVALEFGISERHLQRMFKAAGIPSPGVVIQWFRVLHVIRLLDDHARSVNQTALLLSFSDPANVRRAVRRVTGMTPREVGVRGGLTALCVAFLSQLSPMKAVGFGGYVANGLQPVAM
jgi:AraC-like DNA-binding protein